MAKILERVASGDTRAVQECIDTYGGLLWTLARRILRDTHESEDAVQEIFVELWKSAGRFDPAKGSETAFVATIGRRRLIDRLRQRERAPRGEPLPDSLPQPAALSGVEAAPELARVREAMSGLRPEQRRVLELSVCCGASHSEIAEATGLPLGTVKSHARRALQRVREILS